MVGKRAVYAIVLAAGSGSRMHAPVKKQFMQLLGFPVFYYSIRAFEQHEKVDGIYLVTAEEDIPEMQELCEQYGFRKLKGILAGGRERYHSVYQGLQAVADGALEDCGPENSAGARTPAPEEDPVVLIQDAARPMLTREIISRALEGVLQEGAVVVGMPVKDTIRLLDAENHVKSTPDRRNVWIMQTPQAFSLKMILEAYGKLHQEEMLGHPVDGITDDAMVLERFTHRRVRIIPGSYENIKLTTPEDVCIAELYLKREGML